MINRVVKKGVYRMDMCWTQGNQSSYQKYIKKEKIRMLPSSTEQTAIKYKIYIYHQFPSRGSSIFGVETCTCDRIGLWYRRGFTRSS